MYFFFNFGPKFDFQRSETETTMDTFEPARGFGKREAVEIPVPLRHGRGVHEESWNHLRIYEEAVFGPHRRTLSRYGSEQEIETCKCVS